MATKAKGKSKSKTEGKSKKKSSPATTNTSKHQKKVLLFQNKLYKKSYH